MKLGYESFLAFTVNARVDMAFVWILIHKVPIIYPFIYLIANILDQFSLFNTGAVNVESIYCGIISSEYIQQISS